MSSEGPRGNGRPWVDRLAALRGPRASARHRSARGDAITAMLRGSRKGFVVQPKASEPERIILIFT
jgi:hypothetical protein